MGISERHFKEVSPEETVKKIQGILRECGVEVEEQWLGDSEIGTCSLSLRIKGTQIGSNGKGVNKIYCRASAYAEFIERYQNRLLSLGQDLIKQDEGESYFTWDEKVVTPEEVVDDGNSVLETYFELCGLKDMNRDERIQYVKSNFKYAQMVKEIDKIVAFPFYSMKKGKVFYVAVDNTVPYGSNGMAAGNTPEEALVQGMSEIYERYVQQRVMKEKLTLPDVPIEVIQQYSEIYELYQKTKQIPEIEFWIKDASLGGKYPVVAVIVLIKDTGKFGVKFGSHPDFGIAMERTFTEIAQGRKFAEYAVTGTPDFQGVKSSDSINVGNACKVGNAYYPIEMLGDTPSFEYTPVKDVKDLNNKEMLSYMVSIALKDGYDVLVRDVSVWGFPSYFIIIPGMSEPFGISSLETRMYNTTTYLAKYLNEWKLMTDYKCKLLIAKLTNVSDKILENSLGVFRGFDLRDEAYGVEISRGSDYMLAMAYAYMGDYHNAYLMMYKITSIIELVPSIPEYREHYIYYKALSNYFEAMNSMKKHEKVMDIIRKLYTSSISERIDDYLRNPKEVFVKQYRSHSYRHEDGSTDTTCCDYLLMKRLVSKLKEKEIESAIKQEKLREILGENLM